MSAIACLRVVIETTVVELPEPTLGVVVEKLTSAYLETRWLWPRTFAALTHYAFLLTDSRADQLDPKELAFLSEELQTKLFGKSNAGKVALLLFEGPEEAVKAFAKLNGEDLRKARSDPNFLPRGGRLAQILSEDLVTEMSQPEEPAPASVDRPAPLDDSVRLHGAYFQLKGLFIGDIISSDGAAARERASVVEGADRLPRDPEAFDAACVEAARRFLADGVRSILYIPLAYDSLVRPTQRAALSERLALLSAERRDQLAAIVYNVPREPPFGAVNQMRQLLLARFRSVDLRVEDPDFAVEKLLVQAVTGVSFALPAGDPRTRVAAIRRFVGHRADYKQRRIWSSITNVRTAEELEVCAELGVPFVTGPAVCDPQPHPLAGRAVPSARLPIKAVEPAAG